MSTSKTPITRRTALQVAAAGAATVGLGAGVSTAADGTINESTPQQPTSAENWDLPFLHGVASGDPLPDSVVLWTRITPERDALPGSGLGEDVEVEWQIAEDQSFASPRTGTVTATANTDHTVHVDPGNLKPNSVYYYRFVVRSGQFNGATSPVGRTMTAPAPEEDNQELRFAVASCANWESGFFAAYRDMAQRAQAGEIDHVVFLGDYIYEYAVGEYAGKSGVARMHHPEWEITTLEDYRVRYGRYRTDLNLQAAHAACPWIVVWDDHETANNSWRGGAENHSEGRVEGTWHERRDAAMQAYFEWLPVRSQSLSHERRIYRSLQFGKLAQLTIMDLRSYRDQETVADRFNDPSRTMLGSEQYAWLINQLQQSTTTWDVLGNSVMVSPMKLFTQPGRDDINEAIGFIKERSTGIAVNSDQWDGYAVERDRLLTVLDELESQVLFLTGDIHSEWANSVSSTFGEIGCELVCTSISAPNVDEILTSAFGIYHPEDNSTSLTVEDIIRTNNPWVKHIDFDAHGYGLAVITPDAVDMQFYRVSDVEDPNASVSLAVEKRWEVGSGFVQS